MHVHTQVLSYGKHDEEIATINHALALIKANYPSGHPPEVHPMVAYLLARLDHLMTTQTAQLKTYDQRVHR